MGNGVMEYWSVGKRAGDFVLVLEFGFGEDEEEDENETLEHPLLFIPTLQYSITPFPLSLQRFPPLLLVIPA
jgi:hypothetical protein